MVLSKMSYLSVAMSVAVASAAEFKDMGPAAFMWPDDRLWSGSMDNTAPCGSKASAGNRTDFPMQNGKVALVAQDESYEVELSISYSEGSYPTANDEFNVLIDQDEMRQMDLGHTCVPVADAVDSVTAGDPATLQIKYIADFDKPTNQTFYACADITYVKPMDFDIKIPCFNATETDDGDDSDDEWDYHDQDGDGVVDHVGSSTTSTSSSATATSTGSSDSSNSSSDKDSDEEKSDGGNSGLSGGAIAGIVVGSVAGVAILLGAGFFLYRRQAQRKRAARQQTTSRGVAWEEQLPKGGSVSTASVRMQNLSNN